MCVCLSLSLSLSHSLSLYIYIYKRRTAGEATERSSTSKMTRLVSDSGMISPELRHSFLLSSSTCARDRSVSDGSTDRS